MSLLVGRFSFYNHFLIDVCILDTTVCIGLTTTLMKQMQLQLFVPLNDPSFDGLVFAGPVSPNILRIQRGISSF